MSLIGYWKFDEASGAAAADSSGSGRDAALEGGAGWGADVAGGLGASLSLAGSAASPAYALAAVPLGSSGAAPVNVTLAAWFKTSDPARERQCIMYCGTEIEGHGFGVFINKEGVADGTLFMLFGLIAWNASSARITNANWHHVALALDSSGNPTLYLDGASAGSWSGAGQLNTSDFNIGRSDNATYDSYFHGLIDEVQVYDSALSAGEVLAIFNATRPDNPRNFSAAVLTDSPLLTGALAP